MMETEKKKLTDASFFAFFKLIEKGEVDLIMSAHIYNKNLDPLYPATLSYKTLTLLLRKKMKYKGLIVSDDLQMGAIRKNYTLKESLRLAINAGVDILLFGNQLSKPLKLRNIIDTITALVKEGKVSIKKIDEANRRILSLKSLLQKETL